MGKAPVHNSLFAYFTISVYILKEGMVRKKREGMCVGKDGENLQSSQVCYLISW
jgi:hypothetical protein